MIKKLILFFLLVFSSLYGFAQSKKITGKLVDRDTKDGVAMVTVQMLKSDSTYVTGVLSDENGNFKIGAPQKGNYILKFTSVGYVTLTKNVTITDGKKYALGDIVFSADAIMLKEATVIGQAPPVTVQEDTFVYNTSAYRTPEGSVVEELIKKLPGAQVDDDGKITMNGKEVKKILVDGKEFMTGDTQTALKNLPTSIIDKIKTYDEKSDLAKVTGIDDGEEQTVLDFGIKKGMNKGFIGNADASIGTHDRYAERLMGALFKDNSRIMLMGNANNTNDKGFPGGGGGGRFGAGRQGLNSSKMVGTNFNYNHNKIFMLDGSVRWNHSDGDVRTEQSTENFVSSVGSFSNSLNQNYTRSNSWDARMRLEWKPDTMTNIMFRPNFKYSTSDGLSASTSASYNDDPYLYVSDPLSAETISQMAEDSLMVNTRKSNSISYSESKSVGAMLQLNRKLNSKGRNVTLRADFSYSDDESKSLSTSNVHLYQIKNTLGTDSVYQTNRYSFTPTKSLSYNVQATYSEPIFKAMFLQFSYKFTYKYNKSDRATYDFSNLGENFFENVVSEYRGWNNYFSQLGNPLDSYWDSDLSRYSEYKNYIHDLQLMLRVIRPKYNLNVGVMAQPQTTHFIQKYQGVNTDTTRNVVNISPTLDFRYRFSKLSNLRINYRATTTQPSMTDLMDITDDSDPLNITKGNPGLKPSFTNSFRLFYNTYLQDHQRAIMTYINYNNTRNSISNMVTYDEKTGGRTTKPENINGNWNISSAFMFNTAIDSIGKWNVNTFTNMSYNNYVGYLALDNSSNSQKNTTKTMQINEQLRASFRNSWLEVMLDGSLNYTHSRNLLQSESNLDTWQFSYGGSVNLYLPWGTSISTDLHENSRRGFNDNSMNTNELIWNAQVSQGFLKGKPLTVSLQFYDILHNQSNYSRVINAVQKSDTKYNSINSYAMLHVVYRMNLFGGKQPNGDRRMGPEGGPAGPPPGGGPDRGMRMPRGRFGGM
ncbi:TonB-dependent receptor [uncultured Prevotella sp.]|uniref:TonB-dependent receptor n=1 Tax=uncultured Prevotella sp. TaxID=159272 RepID=UPI0026151157|nr:TonB-dependent receptor [uncultured Prevotella sp.]